MTWTMHEQHDGVASLVLNNPAKLNALTVEMGADFTAAISELASACEKVKRCTYFDQLCALSAGIKALCHRHSCKT